MGKRESQRLKLISAAQKYTRNGKVDAAIKQYKKLLSFRNDDVEVRRLLGDLLYRNKNDKEEALEHYEWIASYYEREGYTPKAIAMYKLMCKVNEDSGLYNMKLAELYVKQGLLVEAKQIYLDSAEVAKRRGQSKEALDIYKKIIDLDPHNTKLRGTLASYYLKEKNFNEAIKEYISISNILVSQGKNSEAKDVLSNCWKETQDLTVFNKLVEIYKAEGQKEQLIQLILSLGNKLDTNVSLLKELAELYFSIDKIEEAEKYYIKVAQLDPDETEIVMKLGKVYLQRGDYDKTFNLFEPVVDNALEQNRVEAASGLLRFIIASNNSYMPALKKLAHIFESTGKNNNLIAIYESMLQIYEEQQIINECKDLLKKLIDLSEDPYPYQEKLDNLEAHLNRDNEIKKEKKEKEMLDDRAREFVRFNISLADEAVEKGDIPRAVDILQSAYKSFPDDIELNEKLFDILQLDKKNIDLSLEQGKILLALYKKTGDIVNQTNLSKKLTSLAPSDNDVAELSIDEDEKTTIDLDIDLNDLEEQIYEMDSDSTNNEIQEKKVESIDAQEKSRTIVVDEREKTIKGLDQLLIELDRYLYSQDISKAEELIEKIKSVHPNSELLQERVKKLIDIKSGKSSSQSFIKEDTRVDFAKSLENNFFEIENSAGSGFIQTEESIATKDTTFSNKDMELEGEEFFIDEEQGSGIVGQAPMEIDFDTQSSKESIDEFSKKDPYVKKDNKEEGFGGLEIDINPDEDTHTNKDELAQSSAFTEISNVLFDEKRQIEDENKEIVKDIGYQESQGEEEFDLSFDYVDKNIAGESNLFDNHEKEETELMQKERTLIDNDSGNEDLFQLDTGDDIFGSLSLDLDSKITYYDLEQVVIEELEAIKYWVGELERHRTSSIEKNMLNVFEDFKKGVDEKFGEEDFETRYNLGIAYKEMGLLDEAIHEFMVSAKSKEKLFDSAGLLGICFRDKGMLEDSVSWLQKALVVENRRSDEYMAVKYELLLVYRQLKMNEQAIELIKDIMEIDSDYRDIAAIRSEYGF